MTSSRDKALEDLLVACRELREDPEASLRIIERVEELDHLTENTPLPHLLAPLGPMRPASPPPKPVPSPSIPIGPVIDLEASEAVQHLVLFFGCLFVGFLFFGLMVLGAKHQ